MPELQTIRPPRTALGDELRKIFSSTKLEGALDYAELELNLLKKSRVK
jgi:hypothetical protein